MGKTLNIAVGLPASGKTTFFRELAQTSYWRTDKRYIDGDELMKDSRYETAEDKLRYKFTNGYIKSVNHFYLDGLFLTTDVITNVLSIITKATSKISKVVIHLWNSDIETCLWNDKYRRNKNSKITIENAEISIDLEAIKNKFPKLKITMKKHKVVKAPNWRKFAEKLGLHLKEGSNFAYGESWSMGGSWGNCWGNSGSVSGEPQPEPVFFDNIMMKFDDNIGFLKYKNIRNQCVSTDEYSEGDYYGGSVTYGRYTLDVEKLYNILVDMEVLDPETFFD